MRFTDESFVSDAVVKHVNQNGPDHFLFFYTYIFYNSFNYFDITFFLALHIFKSVMQWFPTNLVVRIDQAASIGRRLCGVFRTRLNNLVIEILNIEGYNVIILYITRFCTLVESNGKRVDGLEMRACPLRCTAGTWLESMWFEARRMCANCCGLRL